MRLKEEMLVPDFELVDIYGNSISSKDMLGSKYMISFYRYASCPFCNLRMSFLISDYEEFKSHKFKLIALFQSTEEDILNNVGNQKSPFPIIADPKLSQYKKFKIEKSIFAYIKGGIKLKLLLEASKNGFNIGKSMGPKTTIPADFLVDENGVIKYAYYGKDISDHLDLDIVKDFAKS